MKTKQIRFGDTRPVEKWQKYFYIVFDTEEEAQEMVNLLEILRLESRETTRKAIKNAGEQEKKTPEEWEKFGFKITLVEDVPSIPFTAVLVGLLSEKDEDWVVAEMKNLNLPYGSYLAFEWRGSTVVYAKKALAATERRKQNEG